MELRVTSGSPETLLRAAEPGRRRTTRTDGSRPRRRRTVAAELGPDQRRELPDLLERGPRQPPAPVCLRDPGPSLSPRHRLQRGRRPSERAARTFRADRSNLEPHEPHVTARNGWLRRPTALNLGVEVVAQLLIAHTRPSSEPLEPSRLVGPRPAVRLRLIPEPRDEQHRRQRDRLRGHAPGSIRPPRCLN